MEFDAKKCINNIRYLLKKDGKKMNDLEEKVGISAGYLAKIYKQDKQNSLTIPLLERICKYLNITIDTLIYMDYYKIEKNEEKVIKFIDNIKQATVKCKIKWDEVHNVMKEMSMPVGLDSILFVPVEYQGVGVDGTIFHITKKPYENTADVVELIVKTSDNKEILKFNTDKGTKLLNEKLNNLFDFIEETAYVLLLSDKEEKIMDEIGNKINID